MSFHVHNDGSPPGPEVAVPEQFASVLSGGVATNEAKTRLFIVLNGAGFYFERSDLDSARALGKAILALADEIEAEAR